MGITDILELKKKSGMLSVIALIALCFLMMLPGVYAADTLKGKGLGIVIEKPLLISGKLHYSDIIPYDNSISKYSGGFIKNGDDMKREKTRYQNNLNFYLHVSGFTIFVDPPQAVRDKLPLIEIVGNLDEFHRPNQMVITENKTIPLKDFAADQSKRTYSTNRYVDATCTNAVISYKNYTILLPDTIEYLKSGCDPSHTKAKTTIDVYKPITKHDYTTSSKYKLEQFYKSVKECSKVKNGCQSVQNRQVITNPSQR